MTIISLHVASTRAVIAVDGVGQRHAGREQFALAKLLPLPHAGVVLAARGAYRVFLGCAFRYLAIGLPLSFDVVADTAPAVIASAAAEFPHDAAEHTLELFAVGYSDRYGRFAGGIWKSDERGAIVQTESLGTAPGEVGTTFAPWECAEPPPCVPDTDDNIMRLARLQVSAWRSLRSLPVGGPLVRAELTRVDGRTAFEVRTLGEV